MEYLVRVAVLVAVSMAVPAPRLQAQNPDIEAMKRSLEAQIGVYQRLNELEKRVTTLEQQKGGDHQSTVVAKPPSAGPGATGPETTAPGPVSKPVQKTAICQCRGSNRGVCFCLQNGVQCKCHSSKGSEWVLNDAGRAVSKTGNYADPRQVQTPARSVAPAAPVQPQQMIRIQPQQGYCPQCVRQYRFRNDD